MHHLEVDVVSVSPSPQICMMIFSPFLVISTSVNGIAADTRETQAPGPSFWQVRVQWGSTAVSQVSPPHTLTPAVPWFWTCLTSKSVFVSVFECVNSLHFSLHFIFSKTFHLYFLALFPIHQLFMHSFLLLHICIVCTYIFLNPTCWVHRMSLVCMFAGRTICLDFGRLPSGHTKEHALKWY
jgi:hypothetical protein